MRRFGLSETRAFRLLQKAAMDRRTSMANLASALIKGPAASGPQRAR